MRTKASAGAVPGPVRGSVELINTSHVLSVVYHLNFIHIMMFGVLQAKHADIDQLVLFVLL